jgi:hypothetical protein
VTVSSAGARLTMTKPPGSILRATFWLSSNLSRLTSSARKERHACVVTASGRACPVTLTWTQPGASLYIGR